MPVQPSTPKRVAREWVIKPAHPERERLAHEADLHPLIAQLLLERGVESAVEAHRFLKPEWKSLLPPESLPGCVAAARRLAAAVRERQRIVIYGDYDVDGITATTILWHTLRIAGADVGFYVPNRLDEGYGLNGDALAGLVADGVKVVVTVDCGITAVEIAAQARALGAELIITDHHQPQAMLPDALIVHPTALGEQSPNPDLSGAGVALKLAWALAVELNGGDSAGSKFRDWLVDATAFAALGLVADVVPLTGENRVITSFGLRQVPHVRNCGMQALIDVARLGGRGKVSEYDVGFTLAPRLNAIGRLGHAADAIEMFTVADAERAGQIAAQLDRDNRSRQTLERKIVKQAEAMVVERGLDRDGARAIVLASEDWHAGVVGIVASRLVDRFHRPTLLVALENGVGQGSGRSIRHFPLHEALAACESHLISHGGHAMAAGLRVEAASFDAFAAAFSREAEQRLTAADLRPKLRLDDEAPLEEMTMPLASMLDRMAPFGQGNPKPRFAIGPVELVDAPRTVGGRGQHLSFSVREGSTVRKVIAFSRGDEADAVADAPRLRLAVEPLINEWNGSRKVELRLVDWQPA